MAAESCILSVAEGATVWLGCFSRCLFPWWRNSGWNLILMIGSSCLVLCSPCLVTTFLVVSFGIVHRVGIEFVDRCVAKFARLQSLSNLFDQVPIDRLIQPLVEPCRAQLSSLRDLAHVGCTKLRVDTRSYTLSSLRDFPMVNPWLNRDKLGGGPVCPSTASKL